MTASSTSTSTSESTAEGSPVHAGGCLCGVVRFEVTGRPRSAEWCHCRECQRASGAPAIAWGLWPAEAFRVTEGNPACFSSSYRGHRHYCAACGATLQMTDPTDPAFVGVPLTALDEPDLAAPTRHGWTAERVSWFHLRDALPEFEGDTPDEARHPHPAEEPKP